MSAYVNKTWRLSWRRPLFDGYILWCDRWSKLHHIQYHPDETFAVVGEHLTSNTALVDTPIISQNTWGQRWGLKTYVTAAGRSNTCSRRGGGSYVHWHRARTHWPWSLQPTWYWPGGHYLYRESSLGYLADTSRDYLYLPDTNHLYAPSLVPRLRYALLLSWLRLGVIWIGLLWLHGLVSRGGRPLRDLGWHSHRNWFYCPPWEMGSFIMGNDLSSGKKWGMGRESRGQNKDKWPVQLKVMLLCPNFT